MDTYRLRVVCEVNVDAFTPEDAVEVLDDAFGEGDYGPYRIIDMEVVHIQES